MVIVHRDWGGLIEVAREIPPAWGGAAAARRKALRED